MELNISHTSSFQFENKENLRNTAKEILNKNGSSKEATEKIIEETIFDNNKNLNSYLNSQLNIAKASTQINLNETLKYLKKNINKKTMKKETIFFMTICLCNKTRQNY